MLTNPLLGDCSIDDLNQRYKDTYVRYNGTGVYVRGFGLGYGRPNMVMSNAGFVVATEVQDTSVPFDWRLLDCSRPPSRWYSSRIGAFVYTHYTISRQWSRGVCRKNTVMYCPSAVQVTLSSVVRDMFNTENENMGRRDAVSSDLLMEYLEKSHSCLLSPLMLFFSLQGSDGYFLYRSRTIARLRRKTGKVLLIFPEYRQEIMESVIGASFTRGIPNDNDL